MSAYYATSSSTTSSAIYAPVTYTITSGYASGTTVVASPHHWRDIPSEILRGEECEITLPDGSVLHVEKSGNWHIDDTNAQTLYRGNAERDFNRFLNASDILEDFIGFVGGLGVRRDELLALPVSAFIQFLIVRAAQADGESADMAEVVALLPPARKRRRCGYCGRFLRESSRVAFCSADHAANAARRLFEKEKDQ